MSKVSILVLVSGLLWGPLVNAEVCPALESSVAIIPIQSRVLDGAAYDAQEKALWLWFDRGGVYCYRGVSVDLHRFFMKSANKGRFFNLHIRNRFTYCKVGKMPMPEPRFVKPAHVASR